MNVYWQGQSLFRVAPGGSVTTHVKFLVDPQLANQVPLIEGEFRLGALQERGFLRQYKGPDTLAKMKAAAGLFSGLEKTGCHAIILKNQHVIDCEIAFPGVASQDDGGPDEAAGRVDLLSLEPEARLVFWEAKHFSNGDLRARGGHIQVCRQIARYRKYLSTHRAQIEASYKRVVENLVAIDKMRHEPRRLSQLSTRVPDKTQQPTLGAEPKVALAIFGFDKAQRDDPGWKKHLRRLEEDNEIARVVPAGDAKNVRLKLWVCD